MIKPTAGRVVHFIPHPSDKTAVCNPLDQPLCALIAYVHSDTMVNLAVFDSNGCAAPRTSIRLEQDTPLDVTSGSYCRWMPYQTGQAAKTEKLQAQLDAKS